MGSTQPISDFIRKHYLHFNAATLSDAAKAYKECLIAGNKMLISLAGAMSTAQLGISLANMIRHDKVHIISCTGANLEEDVMNLVAHDHYKRIPNYRDITPEQEYGLLQKGLNRVTDTCIPEKEAFRKIQKSFFAICKQAERKNERLFPHEVMFRLLKSDMLSGSYGVDPADSWVVAAMKKKLPILVPGWEDSTLGNIFTSYVYTGKLRKNTIKSGVEYMLYLIEWYIEHAKSGIGFFQIGGGIAGDFPICVVPLLRQDLQREDMPHWSYFCQISESATSYGSYSGAVPNEKITWDKLGVDTPKFIIESDATIVAPLVFSYILGE